MACFSLPPDLVTNEIVDQKTDKLKADILKGISLVVQQSEAVQKSELARLEESHAKVLIQLNELQEKQQTSQEKISETLKTVHQELQDQAHYSSHFQDNFEPAVTEVISNRVRDYACGMFLAGIAFICWTSAVTASFVLAYKAQ